MEATGGSRRRRLQDSLLMASIGGQSASPEGPVTMDLEDAAVLPSPDMENALSSAWSASMRAAPQTTGRGVGGVAPWPAECALPRHPLTTSWDWPGAARGGDIVGPRIWGCAGFRRRATSRHHRVAPPLSCARMRRCALSAVSGGQTPRSLHCVSKRGNREGRGQRRRGGAGRAGGAGERKERRRG
ncbi:unnamed protein product, partial [Urochloa humidicola]